MRKMFNVYGVLFERLSPFFLKLHSSSFFFHFPSLLPIVHFLSLSSSSLFSFTPFSLSYFLFFLSFPFFLTLSSSSFLLFSFFLFITSVLPLIGSHFYSLSSLPCLFSKIKSDSQSQMSIAYILQNHILLIRASQL